MDVGGRDRVEALRVGDRDAVILQVAGADDRHFAAADPGLDAAAGRRTFRNRQGRGLDRFRVVHDGLGHRSGNVLLAQVLAGSKFAGPGETVYVTFKAPAEAGNYPYLCTFSGHFQAGMKGVLTVK